MCLKPKSQEKIMLCPICDGEGCSICRCGTVGVVIGTQERWEELREIRRVAEAVTTKKEGN